MRSLLLVFLLVAPMFAEIRIPLFGGSITIRNNSDGSFTVATEKKLPKNVEKHTKFTLINGTVADFETSTNSSGIAWKIEENPEHQPKKRPSQRRPKSDVLNALLSMFGRF
ncbi:unnamed protein product [Caenorhabditis sp. 36 PRJEB53466]|nr:unnamed protein product [Caenorhabditis sp. 36 PRJEB53466]